MENHSTVEVIETKDKIERETNGIHHPESVDNMVDERDKVNPAALIPHHDGNRTSNRRGRIVLTEHTVDPFFIRNEHGGLTRVTQILVPEESTVQHRNESNINEETFELVPTDELDTKTTQLDQKENDQMRSIIQQLGDSKRAQFLNVTDVQRVIKSVKAGELTCTVNGEKGVRVELKEFPIQPSSHKTGDQKHVCIVCEALGQSRKFKTPDARNKHVRSHFWQILNKPCKFCKRVYERMDNHQNICEMNPKRRKLNSGNDATK